MMNKVLIFLLLMGTWVTGSAQTRYVSDELVITLRSGQSSQHQIVRLLSSGTRLELLDEQVVDGTSYSKVRTQSEIEGWVLSQYLIEQPIARDRLAAAERELSSASARVEALSRELNSLNEEHDAVVKERDRLGKHIDELETEFGALQRAAAEPLALREENAKLHQKLASESGALSAARRENTQLRDRRSRDWFLTGAGVVVGSLLLGILLTRIRLRRRKGWSDF